MKHEPQASKLGRNYAPPQRPPSSIPLLHFNASLPDFFILVCVHFEPSTTLDRWATSCSIHRGGNRPVDALSRLPAGKLLVPHHPKPPPPSQEEGIMEQTPLGSPSKRGPRAVALQNFYSSQFCVIRDFFDWSFGKEGRFVPIPCQR